MDEILGYYLMPHPPIIIPEVGKGEETKIRKTAEACQAIGREINTLKPETIIIITPHGVMFSDAMAISYEERIAGSLAQFHAGTVRIEKEIDRELTERILRQASSADIPVLPINSQVLSHYQRKYELDHGSIVPLSFIEPEYSAYRLVHITYGLLKSTDLYRFGMLIENVVKECKRKAVLIASGDLSHRLSADGPYAYSPRGKIFNESLISLLKKGDAYGVFTIDHHVIEEAGECGLRSLYILLGALNSQFSGELLSYEGPFGVGYGVMKMKKLPAETDVLSRLFAEDARIRKARQDTKDEYVQLARKSIRYFFEQHKTMELPDNLPERMLTVKAGVFVSLKKYGNLRGCIGTFLPGTSCIGEEIIHNAIEAAFEDPRFDPLRAEELDKLNISVDILSAPVPATKEELDPKSFGVIVTSGYRRGLLLPDLEGVNTVDEQLAIACRKAGILPKSAYEIQKFTVERHHEETETEMNKNDE